MTKLKRIWLLFHHFIQEVTIAGNSYYILLVQTLLSYYEFQTTIYTTSDPVALPRYERERPLSTCEQLVFRAKSPCSNILFQTAIGLFCTRSPPYIILHNLTPPHGQGSRQSTLQTCGQFVTLCIKAKTDKVM